MKTEHLRTLRKWPLFTLSVEKWDIEDGHPTVMEVYRTPSGDFLEGRFRKRRPGLIKFLAREDVVAEMASPRHSACSIGRCPDGSWYGWSHRAVCRFRLGDKLFREDFPGRTDDLPFVEWGDVEIRSEAQARKAACNFAAYVT